MWAPKSTTLSLSAPISIASLPSRHPVLGFYAKYGVAFQDLAHTSPTAYYSSDAYINLPNGTSFSGRDRVWAFYENLYGTFKSNTLEAFYMLNIMSGPEPGSYFLTIEYLRGLHSYDGSTVTKVPQVFVYEIGPAQEGEGTDGLQIRGVRCYYDMGLLAKAAKAEGVEIKEFGNV